tara:strand:+ start:187 stop:609 length:423 start_codon:yes stop_codon:yes gene_type:complete
MDAATSPDGETEGSDMRAVKPCIITHPSASADFTHTPATGDLMDVDCLSPPPAVDTETLDDLGVWWKIDEDYLNRLVFFHVVMKGLPRPHRGGWTATKMESFLMQCRGPRSNTWISGLLVPRLARLFISREVLECKHSEL